MADTSVATPLPADEAPPQTSQFVGGLVLGLVLGTAGYYFLGTEEGQHLRRKLIARWEDLAQTLETEKTGAKSNWSERLRAGLRQVAAELGVGGSLAVNKPHAPRLALPKTRTSRISNSTLTPQRSKTKATKERAKFRGV